jgi:hypothetical protein
VVFHALTVAREKQDAPTATATPTARRVLRFSTRSLTDYTTEVRKPQVLKLKNKSLTLHDLASRQ